jgi:delta 1-pyrroline-5-carboxylate dehydrogenase
VYKYIPYGGFSDMYPYLIRRLYENYDIMKYVSA